MTIPQSALLTIILLNSFALKGQDSTVKFDTITVMDGKAKLLLPKSIFKKEKEKTLFKEYAETYNVGKLHCASGFHYENEKVTYRIFHTSLDSRRLSEKGTGPWDLIGLFTDKFPAYDWIGSGYEMVGNTVVFYVDMVSFKKDEEKFLKLSFLSLNNSLVVTSFESPLKTKRDQIMPKISQVSN